ncbi:diguanylate cyclase domain-containing protein [Aquincola tertiaricarbonis]|uniref:diguanylate cyclase domain-containing protein n=1 Tax=Aquincola tertiaricarbonis TaxID=391953 RepID=UPI0006975FB1|nr:diguanylate cyclase [Aquincola tertiaricarbonis]
MDTIDKTTGLPSRLAFEAGVELAIRQGHGFGVLFCDIDLMKLVNDVLGYEVGDRVLERAGDALYSTPDVCLASRSASDEFAALAFCTKSHFADVVAAAWTAVTVALKPFSTEQLSARGLARIEVMRRAAWDVDAGLTWRHARHPLGVTMTAVWVPAGSAFTAQRLIPMLSESVFDLRIRQGSGFTVIL